jgi:hypothetical protein
MNIVNTKKRGILKRRKIYIQIPFVDAIMNEKTTF